MAKLTAAEMIEAIKEMSVLELNELVKAIEEEFGVTAAAPVAVVGGAEAAAGPSENDLSAALFCLLDHKSPDRFFAAPVRARAAGVFIRCAGFPAKQGSFGIKYAAAGAEGQGGVSLQRMLLVWLQRQARLL